MSDLPSMQERMFRDSLERAIRNGASDAMIRGYALALSRCQTLRVIQDLWELYEGPEGYFGGAWFQLVDEGAPT